MKKYLIRAGGLIDCVSDDVQKNMGILVKGDAIAEVKPFDDFTTDCLVVDYSDKTIMPGLFNCHVHVHSNPTLSRTATKDLTDVDLIMEAYLNLQKYIQTGVTYIRNQGSPDFIDLKFKKMIEKGTIDGPGIYASGPSICMTGGHGHGSGLESDGPDACRKSARYLLKNGVDTVKLMATGGVMTQGVEPGSEQLTYKEMKAAVSEAKKAGKQSSAHAQGAQGILNAVRAGVTSIEHGIYLTDEIIDLMVKKGTYLVPTLAAPNFILSVGVEGGVDEYAVIKTKKVAKAHVASFKEAYRRGVKIAMGTDAGTPYNMHDKSWYELKLMMESGMPGMTALKTGTVNAAEMLGLADDYGTIAQGKKADIIVLSENPLDNIETLDNVQAVYKHGKKLKG